MDNLMQILFNTNHEMPSVPITLALLAIAIVVPFIMRQIQNKREYDRYMQEKKNKKKKK